WLEEVVLPGLDWGCSDNQDYRDSVLALASLMTLTLPETYESVWRILNRPSAVAQRDGRSAPLIIVGYPQLTHDTKFGACGLGTTFSAPEVAFANEIAM